MKKLAALILAVLMLFAFAGCKSDKPADQTEPVETTAEATEKVSKKDAIPFEDGQLYAVAFLGNLEMKPVDPYAEYLDTTDLPVYTISKGDFYLVIPRYDNMKLKLSKIDATTEEKTLVKEVPNAAPFIVECNVSDIIQDAAIELSNDEVKTEFTPFISLKDGSIQVGEKGLNITVEK